MASGWYKARRCVAGFRVFSKDRSYNISVMACIAIPHCRRSELTSSHLSSELLFATVVYALGPWASHELANSCQGGRRQLAYAGALILGGRPL